MSIAQNATDAGTPDAITYEGPNQTSLFAPAAPSLLEYEIAHQVGMAFHSAIPTRTQSVATVSAAPAPAPITIQPTDIVGPAPNGNTFVMAAPGTPGGNAIAPTTTAPTTTVAATSDTSTTAPASTGTGDTTATTSGGGGSGVATTTDTALLDALKSLFGGNAQAGTTTGEFAPTGTVPYAPVDPNATDPNATSTSAAPSLTSSLLHWVVLVAIVGGAYWLYKRHKAGAL